MRKLCSKLRSTRSFSRGHALIVTRAEASDPPWLQGAIANDGHDLVSLLTAPEHCGYPGHQVSRLQQAQATPAQVLFYLGELARTAGPRDTVIVYFSGHGCRTAGPPPSFAIRLHGRATDPASALLSEARLSAALAEIRAARLVVILDCCWAEGTAELVRSEESPRREPRPGEPPHRLGATGDGAFDRLAAGEGRVIIAASKRDQSASGRRGFRNSLFTHHLLRALSGGAGGWRGKWGGFWIDLLGLMRRACARQGGGRRSSERILRRIEGRIADAQWGTIRIFETFAYLQRRLAAETGPRQSAVLKTHVTDDFAVALHPPWLCEATAWGALLAVATLALVLPISRTGGCDEQLHVLLHGGPTVARSFKAEATVGGTLCPPSRWLSVLIKSDDPEVSDWHTLSSRVVDGSGTFPFELRLPERLATNAHRFELAAVLSPEPIPPGPITFSPSPQAMALDARSPPLHLELGGLEIAAIDGRSREGLRDDPQVPVAVAVSGTARHLDGRIVEILTRPLTGRGLPWRFRAEARIFTGAWDAGSVPIRDRYDRRTGRYALWARIKDAHELSTEEWGVRIEPFSASIIAINDRDIRNAPCAGIPPGSVVKVRGEADNVLPGESVYSVIMGRKGGVSSGRWFARSVVYEGTWESGVKVEDGDYFEVYAGVASAPPVEEDLSRLGSPIGCPAD